MKGTKQSSHISLNSHSQMKPKRFALYAWGVVAWNLLVIVWGAYVRASGSGAGCGSHWPLCNGEVIPDATQTHTLIEFTHRMMSGLTLVLVIGLAVWAFRAYPKRHTVRLGALLSTFFIFTEALIGAGLVLFKLVADDASVFRAVSMSVHLINTFVLLAVLTLTAWWASGGPILKLRGRGIIAWLCALALVLTLVLAVSGAVTALGDTLFPVSSLSAGLNQDFSSTAHLFVRLRLLHPLLALTDSALIVLVALVAGLRRPRLWVKRYALMLIALVLVQLGAGLVNVALLAPIWLQLTHLLLADLVWLALVLLTASVLAQEATVEERLERLSFHTAMEV
jgi:heme A synthase